MPTHMISSDEPRSAPTAPFNAYRFYTFRIWYGMVASAWLSLLARNRFAVSGPRLPFAMIGLLTSLLNSALNLVQRLIFGRRIRGSVIEEPPIFIIGHWRTGTTLLHELLTLDERFTAPTTLECFAPADCLLLRWLPQNSFTFVLPRKRPMDDMAVGWKRPQEDEFALMNLGLRSPYEVIVFPNHRQSHDPFVNMTELTPEQIEQWKAAFLSFLQLVNFRSRAQQKCSESKRRIVIKSPYHTARLHILRQMFPEAKFIHVVRDPCEVFPSTVRFWQALFDTQGCQQPEFGAVADTVPDIERYVFDSMDLLYRDFFDQVAQIPGQNFCEVRYENLARTPIEEMARIYSEVQFGSFDKIRPKLEDHLRELKEYKTNKHHMSARQRAEVHRRWAWYMDRFGYQARSAT